MRKDPVESPEPSTFYPRVFALVTAGVLAVALLFILKPFIASIAWALLAAFILYPLHRRLSRWLKGRTSLSSILLTLATLVICVGPLTGLAIAFVRQAAVLLEKVQARTQGVDFTDFNSLSHLPLVGQALDKLQDAVGVSSAQLQGWATSGIQALLKYFPAAGGWLFMGALGTVLGFAMTLFLLFFFLRDGAAMEKHLVKLVPLPETRKRKLVDYLAAVTRAVMVGTLLTALIQGALLGIGFAIIGLPSPVVFGVIAAILSLLPIGGTSIVWIPAAIILAAQGRYGAAVFIGLWGALLVGLVDNFLKPLLISGRAEVPTLAAFLGVLGGLSAFGPVGMFVGPILIALTIALLRYAEENRASKTV